ncbi:alpha/beta fold hydrolase [Streptomyces sp. NPDC005202]|uniref:alpha/beta fold hydrolase n=1 Tax=Streptomyces sp. NPDC005202 TaxID=3157021 RepID=UPI0033B293F5
MRSSTSSARKEPSVFDGVASFTRVCAHDRPGTVRCTQRPSLTTRSTPPSGTRSLAGMSSDLGKLLAAAKVPGPYLLVGHSFGGMVTRLYAQEHPSQVAGLVFVDAFGVNTKPLMGNDWPAYAHLVNNPGTPSDNNPHFEKVDIDGAIAAINEARPLPKVPPVVLSKSQPFATSPGAPKDVLKRLEAAWPEVQDALVALEPQTPHITATGSDHYVQMHDPDLTTSAIKLVHGRAEGGTGRPLNGGAQAQGRGSAPAGTVRVRPGDGDGPRPWGSRPEGRTPSCWK